MHTNDFNVIIEQQIDRSTDMLMSKNAHYNPEGDKLASFKKAAALRGQTPRQALAGMMLKHTVSVYDLCDASSVGDLAVWNEKITDHINYLLLLRAIVEEEGMADPNKRASEEAIAILREKLTEDKKLPLVG
ncbi:hypothetical protein SEA_LEWANDO_45 [Arthrobacter phage Lewando]|nr:hypothetical protein SEA_LEWANDO_45 [Arthrobacter phage Lewando]